MGPKQAIAKAVQISISHLLYYLEKIALPIGQSSNAMVVYDFGVSKHVGLKKPDKKLTKFAKTLNYIKSSCVIFCAKIIGYSHDIYCLQEESTHSGLRLLKNLDLEVLKHFWFKKSHNTSRHISQRFWNYTKSSYIILILLPPPCVNSLPLPTKFYYLPTLTVTNWFCYFFHIF